MSLVRAEFANAEKRVDYPSDSSRRDNNFRSRGGYHGGSDWDRRGVRRGKCERLWVHL